MKAGEMVAERIESAIPADAVSVPALCPSCDTIVFRAV